MTSLVEIPTDGSTDRLIGDGEAALRAGVVHLAAEGDPCVVCVDEQLDLWRVYPVACVDSDGVVMGLRLRDGRTRALARITRRTAFFVNARACFGPDLETILWRDHRGALGAKEAMRPHLVKAP